MNGKLKGGRNLERRRNCRILSQSNEINFLAEFNPSFTLRWSQGMIELSKVKTLDQALERFNFEKIELCMDQTLKRSYLKRSYLKRSYLKRSNFKRSNFGKVQLRKGKTLERFNFEKIQLWKGETLERFNFGKIKLSS